VLQSRTAVKRRLFNLVVAVSLVTCLAAVLLFILSFFKTAYFQITHDSLYNTSVARGTVEVQKMTRFHTAMRPPIDLLHRDSIAPERMIRFRDEGAKRLYLRLLPVRTIKTSTFGFDRNSEGCFNRASPSLYGPNVLERNRVSRICSRCGRCWR
jgi:hypothetical protein